MTTNGIQQWGVWDTRFNDWDSGPYSSTDAAVNGCYPGMPKGADRAKYSKSKSLVVREWLKRGQPGEVVS